MCVNEGMRFSSRFTWTSQVISVVWPFSDGPKLQQQWLHTHILNCSIKLLLGTIVVVVLEPRWISKSRQSGRLDYLGHSTPAWGKMNNLDINGKTRVKLWHMEQDILIYRWFVFLYAEVCESFLIWTLFCFELKRESWETVWCLLA